tara:strand:+ start:1943 stop:2629 length:687 start_codon:yes stop_codon:yes gene_type:complete
MKVNKLIDSLEKEFKKKSNPTVAKSQKAYMRNQFDFHGLTANERRDVQYPLFKKHSLLSTAELNKLTITLWNKDQRDYQYCAQELLFIHAKTFKKEDIDLFEFMIINKSWWDTIDFLSPKIVGEYFKLYPETIENQIEKWLHSNNIWLQRSCLIFQLKYKETLNTQLLTQIIQFLLGSKEFFINKAIGWILREYSKTNPQWVIKFVYTNNLNTLSKREALKFINRKKI